MKNRIKSLRKNLNMNQTDFGSKIGLKQTTIAGYETGSREPNDAVILSICKEFNVNENWLRSGVGEMFNKRTKDQKIADFIGDIFLEEEESFKRRFVSMLADMDEDQWALLAKMANALLAENKKD
ncbi:helix-turn-helix domain-containing protein [Eubacterium callanderi]|uniref:Transcriptional regulator n=2 Tax=Eubacterium callanderi TaxID=53442 RepID=E3GL07_9FIRM|nr:helix-turn-helix transcriptional regulator [Eubacterium callanderi]OEZ03914.1 helix-turn-helix domain protein [[Butyribacterium] methylotrophicum]ADO36249.1 hypothetical protein ELI_1263 [Eubacterium callanderi]AEU12320.1 transcriptional regulator [Eubacterium callanderi]MCB6661447.1 helix-turn-helix domain-containing protein [Eubacterium callanderi]MCB6754540.1 helix-turn-helix domain-containing protein [Eubacterium callanderi]